MSEETELRECDEAFESEEGDIEPYLDEPESSRELLERLRELEAENSALALANESQREAYERCLDEVANHVVQALLNQKDLREECIKLKMRVFDLERQNRTLTELFHQKLHSQSSTFPVLELPMYWCVRCVEDSLSNGTADTRAPPTSMEALSPFFKKKAHILEVLRRLEETDPLKFHPCPGLTSCHEFNQALIPAEAVLVPSGISMQPKAHQPTCRHSCSDSDIHEYPNGEGTLRSEELGGLRWSEVHGASAHNTDFQTTVPLADDGDRICVLSTSAEQNSLFPGNRDKKSEEPPQLGSRDGYLYSGLKDAGLNDASNGEPKDTPVLGESKTSDLHESCSNKLSTFAFVLQCKTPRSEAIDLPLTEISSPSRLLKFLKIPTIGERAQATNPLRLSPQLTRSSKIPCRNNNYEVHHSPVTGRKATTTERDRQPQSSRTDSYPVTHSAPTSPPKPEDSCSPTAREINFSSHSAPKASHSSKMVQSSQSQRGCQKMPHYENVSDVSTSYHVDSSPQFFEGQNASHFLPYSQSESCNEDQPKLLEEKMLSHSFQQPSVSPTVDQHCDFSPSDTDTDTESADCGAQRGEPPSKKSITGKPPSESSHHLFKERLAALGKLKSTEDLNVNAPPMDKKDLQCNVGKAVSSSTGEKSKTAERQSDHNAAENKQSKYTDSLDGKPYHKHNPSNHPIKFPGPIQQYESGNKPVNTSSPATKTEVETFSSKIYVAKAEGPKIKVNMPSSCSEPPQVLRNYMKCSTTQNPPYSSKTAPSPQSSPTKVPSKSPSKPGQVSSNPRAAKPFQDDRISQKPSPRAEDKNRLTANKKKSSAYAENLPPAPPRPSEVLDDRRPFASGPQSAIEQKVMKGIEENMLKLQEQDRGHMAEVKQKASNGIASWFGLKKSKLPALNRKPEMSKLKLSMPSASKEAKAAAKKKLEVESLNISKLMEKAEDLRRALEEERAYVNGVALDRPGRGHSCEVVMDQAQGQLSVMYRGMSSDNFMQQLLNRKDVPSDDSLAESISSQHFTGSGSSMRTLDSGIGTFPLPDYAGGAVVKSVPKFKSQGEQEFLSSQGKLGPVTKAPRKAHTLERELSALEEVNTCALYGSALEEKDLSIQLSNTIHEADMQSPPSKNWTFPNLKPTTGPTDMYLGVKEETETAPHGTPFRRVSFSP
uniref:Nck-associated protein 5-like n=1 Tax=Scleropages formosus TaxID=113540 RepID=A0A8C9RZF2_SCLFO